MKGLIGSFAASLLLAAASTLSAAAQPAARAIPDIAGKVMTVQGPVDPATLGVTLMHEHIFIDFKPPPPMAPPPTGIHVLKERPDVDRGDPKRGLVDYEESLAAIREFKTVGGGTIVDVTNFGLTRDPEALLRVSKDSGLHVVMGAGWYQKKLHPADMDARTVAELADIVVQDVTVGAQGTNIRSGIIGEIGINGRPLVDNERKSARASARAARITGAPLSVHSFGSPEEMLEILDIIASEGVPLNRVTMSHTGGGSVDFMEKLFARGVYVEWDYMAQAPLPPEQAMRRIESLDAMIQAGHAQQILIAHDICTQAQLKKNGGGGYTYIHDVILPGLKAKGVSEAVLRQITVDNPRRALTFGAPQAPIAQPG